MPLTKVCPQCCAIANMSKSACECGHFFTLKGKAPVVTMKSKRTAMRDKRVLESKDETLLRQKRDSIRHAQRQALETEQESVQRKQQNRGCKAKTRALESQHDALKRKNCDRKYKAAKRALETQDEVKTRTAKKRTLETRDESLQTKTR